MTYDHHIHQQIQKSQEHKFMDLPHVQISKGRDDAHIMEITGDTTPRLLFTTLVALEAQFNPTIGRSPKVLSTWNPITSPPELLAKTEKVETVQPREKKRAIPDYLHLECH